MARVTVEDCVEVVDNRFELVALAGQRARDIASGAAITIERDNDKDSVVALREIAKKSISAETLREEFIKGFQKALNTDTIDQTETQTESQFASPEQIAEEMKALQVATEEDEGLAGESFADDNVEADD